MLFELLKAKNGRIRIGEKPGSETQKVCLGPKKCSIAIELKLLQNCKKHIFNRSAKEKISALPLLLTQFFNILKIAVYFVTIVVNLVKMGITLVNKLVLKLKGKAFKSIPTILTMKICFRCEQIKYIKTFLS